ncbi:hypothetical protein BATDEDRAFT_35228 [Batrachochytrium dendrobatidis JAM81]|uniref:non-specific serine/threonine protein kinase n=1 Tax=Batrachochytrium dendrobatidis (strain JAM81 / FGSC 10211) TaxID=684364 RepID=F4P4D2_BATDJ|nr:uncharacterized protein BATDEDRAFT_35228 [Batrachochytrium dendrobatidis JAM81]EGF79689.1 hypothetical protein BATDEDRAFT_35228 [Batrachochytrium dendrobatidis JAM81]|eukprot:XP_006679549.1 hypothetical protein BATDEDRAFT_35228 [Batrachochytrium dendrobatidis JAM81]
MHTGSRVSSKETSFPNVQALACIDEVGFTSPAVEVEAGSLQSKTSLLGSSFHDNKSILASMQQHRDSFLSTHGSSSNIEKPTLILYPRKSIMSGSLRDLAQMRSSIMNIPEGAILPSTMSTKTSRDSVGGSRASLIVRSMNRGMNGSIGYISADARRSLLQISPEGQIGIPRPVPVISEASHADLEPSMALGSSPHQDPYSQQVMQTQASIDQILQEKRPRPVSLVSLKNLNKFKESLINVNPASQAFQQQSLGPPIISGQTQTNNEYYEYLMLSQRHSSSNFIQKVDSSEIIWASKSMPLKMVGTYLLGDKIGKGAFGKVKEGVCSETLQRVAVKIIAKKRLRKAQNGLENIIREIKMLRSLKHQNIVTLVDVFAKVEDKDGNIGIFPWFTTIEEEPIVWLYDDGREEEKNVKVLKWYLVFEYCPCSLQTLLDQCEGHKLSISQAHRYFVQLMDGLSYLHSKSIIHRDIKPGNMLITSDGTLKISDFGVAEHHDIYDGNQLRSDVFAGTHQFLAPEIAEGAEDFDSVKVDVWACGVTLYNMISGRFPFEFDESGNLLELYEKIMAGAFEMPKEAGSNLIDLLSGMLNKDVLKRFTVAQIQSSAWVQSHYSFLCKSLYIPTFKHNRLDTPTSSAFYDSETLKNGSSTTPKSSDVESHIGNVMFEASQSTAKESTNDAYLTPCETTMIPFLSSMYKDEIEQDLDEHGTVFNDTNEDTESLASIGKKKHKIVGWIKNVFGSKGRLAQQK